MTRAHTDTVEAQWARLGVVFNTYQATQTPDLERLLLATARRARRNARLLPLAVTWLALHGQIVAGRRLKGLIASELAPEDSAILGLILEAAMQHGAPSELRIPLRVYRPAPSSRAYFDVDAGNPLFREIARENASPVALEWNLYVPEITPRHDAIRPITWILAHNPTLRDRLIRKGDLRTSILEALRNDTGGEVPSESQLARLAGATRSAVRKALAALVKEGEVTISKKPGNARDHVVTLRRAS